MPNAMVVRRTIKENGCDANNVELALVEVAAGKGRLAGMQAVVEGYIECVGMYPINNRNEKLTVYANDEGAVNGMYGTPTCFIRNRGGFESVLYGPVLIIASDKRHDRNGLTPDDIASIQLVRDIDDMTPNGVDIPTLQIVKRFIVRG